MKEKVLNWLNRFDTFSFLDNHQYQFEPHTVECLVAAGVKREIRADAENALERLQQFIDEKKCWLFGHLGYDLKNEIEAPGPVKQDPIGFPDLYFFEPEVLIRLSAGEMSIEAEDPEGVFLAINKLADVSDDFRASDTSATNTILIQNRLSQEEYLHKIVRLKQHILRGDCYEINFCQEFYAANAIIEPMEVYRKLSAVSPNPFSACYRVKDQWLLCASPERFLKKQDNKVLSQPIKGTSKRVPGDAAKDEEEKLQLSHSSKDQSENVMVVDLVRNDLAKICTEGSVKVDELFGVYSFPQVHQMISTISGELLPEISFAEIMRAVFPMGSMTGAPKKRVIELIDEYEPTRRGIFSGATGYISPGGDFDLNVVIRSILYNACTKYLSFQAGSGITFNSDPKKEWEECLLKGEAMKKVLEQG